METRIAVAMGVSAKALLISSLLLAGARLNLQAQQANAWQVNDNSSFAGTLEYLSNLTAAQALAARTNGWHYSLISRILSDTANPAANGMAFGDGVRRFYVYFDLDSVGNLTAQLLSTSNVIYRLNIPAPDVLKFHLHELVYNPTTGRATYSCDGIVVTNWAGDFSPAQSNQVVWGANTSLGKGIMNYHRAEFDINGLGAVATYDAGFAGAPATAPSPTNRGWTRLFSGIGLTEAPLSPDGEYIHPAAVTGSATALRPGEATLNGSINPNGWPAIGWFEHGPTPSYGGVTPITALGNGTSFVTPTALVTGLPRGALYHFRLVASNSVGTVTGNDMTFTVLDSPGVPSDPTGGGQPFDIRQPSVELNYLLCTNGYYPVADTPPFVGEVRLFAGNFAPAGWTFCQGQLLSVSDYSALFNLFGTTYGGDGVTNFALPDMRGRTVTCSGTLAGENWILGQTDGSGQLTLVVQELPTHTHTLPPPYTITGSTGGSQPRPNRQSLSVLSCLFCLQGVYPVATQPVSEPFIAQMPLFAANGSAPSGTTSASGQLLPINQNQALYAVVGTNYGGDGRTTFALPDMRGRTPLGVGQGPGLTAWSTGQQPGVDAVTMTEAQMPAHQHSVSWSPPLGYTTGVTGGGQPQSLMQPSFAIQYLIATNGELPSVSVQATNRMIGEIQLFGGTNVPNGWTPCNGQLLSVPAYAALFSVLSNAFGGDGITTFALPSLSGRIPVGTLNGQPGAAYGAEQATLTLAQLPPHTHTVPAPDYDYWITVFGVSGPAAAFDADADNDGAKNGLEWATGTNPTNGASFLPLSITKAGPQVHINFTRNTNATDVVWVLQRTANLANSNAWTGLVTNLAGAWSPPAIVNETGAGNPVTVSVSDNLSDSPAAHYRLKLNQP